MNILHSWNSSYCRYSTAWPCELHGDLAQLEQTFQLLQLDQDREQHEQNMAWPRLLQYEQLDM